MLSSFIIKRPNYSNTFVRDYCMRDYCMNSTKKSIQKITEKYHLEKDKDKYSVVYPFDNKYHFIYNTIIMFLSFTIYSLTFYKQQQ